MPDESFLVHLVDEWQRRYEALGASLVDRLPAKVVADRLHYSVAYMSPFGKRFKGLNGF